MKTYSSLTLELDLTALESNLAILNSLGKSGQKFIASVKANAYGHGIIHISERLQHCGVDMLATGSIDEARQMRHHGILLPILLFAFAIDQELISAVEEGFIPTLTDFSTAKYLSEHVDKNASVYVKVDAGLGRLGTPLEDAESVIKQIDALPNIQLDGIYTHVPFADTSGRQWADQRLQEFEKVVCRLAGAGIKPDVTQAIASSCLLAGLNDPCNAVCVGHALYGLSPYAYSDVADMSAFIPVLKSLKTKVIHTCVHQPGTDVAIAGMFNIAQEKNLGVLPIGLAHGIRSPVQDAEFSVLVRGKLAKVVLVTLEHTTIDITNVPECKTGDTVWLVGEDGTESIELNDLAASWGVPPLEALMSISTRSSETVSC